MRIKQSSVITRITSLNDIIARRAGTDILELSLSAGNGYYTLNKSHRGKHVGYVTSGTLREVDTVIQGMFNFAFIVTEAEDLFKRDNKEGMR